jgi:hypothetical protein
MKISGILISLAIAAFAVAPAMAQQSLGDVAGSIKLKRPESESVVIDQNNVGKARRGPTSGTETDLFREILDDCLTDTRGLHGLLVETRDGESFYREEWRGRVQELGLQLDGALEELGLVRVESRYGEALDLAWYGSDTASDALEILRGAIDLNRPVYSEARTLSEEAIRAFESAQKSIGAASRAAAAEELAPPINPIEANRVMTSLCGGRHGAGSNGYESCIAEQRAAVDAMAGRSAPGVGLDAISFNVIRNNCRFEWADNYVNQDRCERTRIAAKRTLQ